MTTLMIVDGYREGETRSQVIARRIKGEIAQIGLSMVRAAGLVGMTQSKFSRRMTGNVDFGVGELNDICEKLGISFEYVVSGIRQLPTPPDGIGAEGSPPSGLNRRPSLYTGGLSPARPLCPVVPLYPAAQPAAAA